MTSDELGAAINQTHNGMSIGNQASDIFLQAITAGCKAMYHTNKAAKNIRRNMFAMAHKFGLPAIFFTVTPDDGNCFCMRVYADPKETHIGVGPNMTTEESTFDF